MTPLEAALEYQKRGFSVIPVRNKKPLIQWAKYQKQRADATQIRAWWSQYPDAGVGIVTGEISDLYVIDADGPNGIRWVAANTTLKPTVKTPSKGYHYWCCLGNGHRNATGFMPELDFRGNGGYVVAPPTITDAGAYVQMGSLPDQLPVLPECVKVKLSKQGATDCTISAPNCTIEDLGCSTAVMELHHNSEGLHQIAPSDFTEGKRDNTIFHLALTCLRGGMPVDEAMRYCAFFAASCSPPFPVLEAQAKVLSAKKHLETVDVSRRRQIIDWVYEHQEGRFSTEQIYRAMDCTSASEKSYVRRVLSDLHKANTIATTKRNAGEYRFVNSELPIIDWQNASIEELNVRYPLGIERFFMTMPKNVILIAGEQNSGKTAFALNFAAMNAGRGMPVRYVSSEMGAEELALRIGLMEPWMVEKMREIDFRDVPCNFQDAVLADGITVIDYMEVNEEFWKIGEWLGQIYKALKHGICVVMIQKDAKKQLGRGDSFGKEKPRLYLTLVDDYPAGHVCKVEKCKNFRSGSGNPNFKRIRYKITDGIKLRELTNWEAS